MLKNDMHNIIGSRRQMSDEFTTYYWFYNYFIFNIRVLFRMYIILDMCVRARACVCARVRVYPLTIYYTFAARFYIFPANR
jgi:hypothetical protein